MTSVPRVFSCGGGVQSTAALVLAAQGEIDFPVFCFANVGDKAENPDTLTYVDNVLKPYAVKHGIKWVTTQWHWKRNPDRSPDLYDELMRPGRQSVDIPLVAGGGGFMGNRACTSKWKRATVERYLKSIGFTKKSPGVLGKGISTDEHHRAVPTVEGDCWTNEYPLIELGIDRNQCRKIIKEAGLPMAPKSSCWFCPYKTTDQWATMQKQQPELFAKAVELERRINEIREARGKDKAFLSAAGGKKSLALDEMFSTDQIGLFPEWIDEQDGCESGYCMT